MPVGEGPLADPDIHPRADVIRRLYLGFRRRTSLPGGAAREGLDAHLLELVERLGGLVARPVARALDAPGRDTSLAMALALASQPHIVGTFADPDDAHTGHADPPMSLPPENLRVALGLQAWEVDEIRDDVDRRASDYLRQRRAASFLWHAWVALDPNELVRRLLPGAPPVDLSLGRAGGQIYGLVDGALESPVAMLVAPWLASVDEDRALPLDAFSARYVDPTLRAAVSRGIGATEAEVADYLDAIVTLVPRRGQAGFLHRDRWRAAGAGALTGLGASYGAGHRVVAPIPPDAISLEGWLSVADGRLRVGDVEAVFDQVAIPRVAECVRLVLAGILAMAWSDGRIRWSADDLALFDLTTHLNAALDPVLRWPTAPATVARAAKALGATPNTMSAAMARVGDRWTARAERWLRAPTAEDPWPLSARLVDLAVRFGTHTQAILDQPTLTRPHASLALLFAGHRVAGASDAELLPGDPAVPGLAEVLVEQFWGAWARVDATARPTAETWRDDNGYR